MFRPKGKQPPLGIIFRGKGIRISVDEQKAWHPSTHVFFQPNAWMDINVCEKWVDKTLKGFIESENLERFVLLLDNLTTHTEESFKKSVSDLKGLVWFGLADATDLWQPVDAGYAQVLKSLIAKEQQDWLDVEENSDRWFGNEKSFTAKERRILISQWAGEAWDKLSDEKYDKFRENLWQKTGCLMTADGSEDSKILPEGLEEYSVPPPSILEPAQPAPITIHPESATSLAEFDAQQDAMKDITEDEEVEFIDHLESSPEQQEPREIENQREGIFDIFHLLV